MEEFHTVWAGHPRICYDTADSTNLRAGELAKQGKPCHGTLITAEEQTAGRGRLGRTWHSPKGTSVSMSLILQPEFPAAKAAMLTIVAAMALRRSIAEATGLEVQIKWPNDIVYRGKKLCGILTEMRAVSDRISYVIIGMGINSNVSSFPDELPYAVSLKMILGRDADNETLIAGTMRAFEWYYGLFLETEDLSRMTEEYETYLAGNGDRVQVLEKNPYWGICKGICSDGSLKVLDEAGTLHLIQSGEVSVRGMYGYI